MPVTIIQLKSEKKYRAMDVPELYRIIGSDLDFDDFEKLPGEWALDKAKLLYRKWHKKPLKKVVAKNSTSSNKIYKTALVSIRKIDSMRISNSEKISKIAAVLLGLNPVKNKPDFV